MDLKEFETILKIGEHVGVEFKSARGGAKDDTFETVCSFLNRFGGDIFLGVNDEGKVVGVPEGCVEATIKNIIRVTNNPELQNPIIAKFFKQMGRADELGSGTRNLYHYTRLYSNADPVLDEGDMFTTTIPLNDVYSVDRESVTKPSPALSEGINEGISEGINEGIKSHLIEALRKTPGLSVPKLVKIVGKSRATVERALYELVNQEELVEHRGSKKTGGYYVL